MEPTLLAALQVIATIVSSVIGYGALSKRLQKIEQRLDALGVQKADRVELQEWKMVASK